jgi:hypothetical protein
VLGAVFQHVAPSPFQFLDGFRAADYVGAGVRAAGAVLAVLLPRPLRSTQDVPQPAVAA